MVALFSIFAILVAEFGRFKEALVVAGVIPLGTFGGLVALWATGNNLSFLAIIGFVALIGCADFHVSHIADADYGTIVRANWKVADGVYVAKGAGGEIQLTDAMAQMIGRQPFNAVTFDGKRYDCGSKVGYIEANLALALQRPDMAEQVRAIALNLLK